MQMKRLKKALSLFLCMALIVAVALITTGCNGNTAGGATTQTEAAKESRTDTEDRSQPTGETGRSVSQEAQTAVEGDSKEDNQPLQEAAADVAILGEGSQSFPFSVLDKEGNETQFEIHTDKETVGEALLELGLIAGEDGPYGLYVKTVNGLTADYDKDKVYWAFYVNDAYASAGVDLTEIVEGEHYSFRME